MDFNDQEPMTDEQLSALLKKWDAGAAPEALESLVWAERRSVQARRHSIFRNRVLIPAAICGLAVAAGVGAWLLSPIPRLPRRVYARVDVVQPSLEQPAPSAAAQEVAVVRPLEGSQQSGTSGPAQSQQQGNQQSSPRGDASAYFFSTPLKASPFDAKPFPEPVPQEARAEAPLPSGVYRVGNGVSAPGLLQKKEPEYSEEARIAKLSGTTLVQIVVGEDGSGGNLNVIRPLGLGLDEKAVEAVRAWRFKPGMKDGAAVPVQASIEINFRLVENTAPWRLTRALFNPPAGVARPVLIAAPYPADAGSNVNDSVRVSFEVDENGVPINFRSQTKSNPKLESEAIGILSAWRFQPGTKDGKAVTVPATFDFNHGAGDATGGQAIRVGAAVASSNLIDKVVPAYPRDAKAARIQGVVTLAVRIGKDGHVTNATVISGDPLLAQAALEAVRQWLYRPTLLNGNPVEVDTQVDVNFTLSK
jgi:TonB family protein